MPRNFGGFYPPSTPRAVANGLKARSQRGAIGATWWSKRFITILDGFGMGSRLQRGRSYARKGQVISLAISPGTVHAKVQGSGAHPYRVRIDLAVLSEAQWQLVQDALNQDAWFVASLLDGQMPEDIEQVFSACGLSLFPAGPRQLSMSCSCPDSAVPCKHLAATFYLLAERFDEDPFGILAWRGRGRERLLGSLETPLAEPESEDRSDAALAGRPLEESLEDFYRSVPAPAPRPEALGTALLLDQLPETGIKVGGKKLETVLRPLYQALREG
ncbi:SWIM zinc finger family protein [Glutamicibacter sp. NPDC087344]|uniref:SWIM zinc finger family protein n=1 Tax=Glutamicibacter sp. NPDC087344 TaxID=3363994 RepID=UPI0038009091